MSEQCYLGNVRMICFFFTSVQQAGEVRRLNSAIGDLRGACDSMVKKVTTLTGGKGEFKLRGMLVS